MVPGTKIFHKLLIFMENVKYILLDFCILFIGACKLILNYYYLSLLILIFVILLWYQAQISSDHNRRGA